MRDSTTTSLATASVLLVLVILLSLPAVSQCVKRYVSNKLQNGYSDRYEDEDGAATEESEAAYSDYVQRLILVLVSIVGTLDCLVAAVLTATRAALPLTIEQWLQFATWAMILYQAVILFTTPTSTRRYTLGIYGGVSCLLLAIAIPVENFSLWFNDAFPPPHNIHLTLSIVQFAGSVILLFTNFLIPRRPDVYRNEKVVDRQRTCTFLSKITFSWCTSLLLYAASHKTLDYEDLPVIDNETRSDTLKQRFESVGKKDKLWKALFWSHKWAFAQQWALQAVTSITNFLPQIALLYILRALEARDAGQDTTFLAWVLVIGLSAAVAISSWLESWMFFIVFMKLGVPVYEQLSAVVFGKAVRRKDVKSTGKKKDDDIPTNGEILPKGSVIKDEEAVTDEVKEEDDEDVQKSRQSTINLVGVDSKRIADFATFNYLFLGSIIKLIFAFGFLAKLIGWVPLLAGLAVPILIMPINIVASKRYADAQDDLMKVRDQKMAVVTEALQGIRQIKFSALEKNWYEKIIDIRRRELKTQWRVFIFDTTLISIWIFQPVLLAAVSLSAYAIINKTLSPSVAFTTISVFEVIEMTLSVLPEMTTEFLDARVSAERVQKYLDSPEIEETTKPGNNIAFEDATVSWPVDDTEDNDDKFSLRNLTIKFPSKELSVVSGKTGSGKSLLLASIIGEADVISGSVYVPRAPQAHERYDSKATSNDWYIASSIAFVAQIPWIENATIRDNITFGLPYETARYRKVLGACALEKDLDMLPDGELTDIGANGINLSGGQKWRVSFARALYSRAGILILDDIFSAVDANVGRHLFEEALTGELGQGRTRILVTHHVALCLPKTKYSVLLGEGTVQQAGETDQLRRSGQLKAILAHDVEEQQKEEDEFEKQSSLTVDDGGGALHKMLSHRSRRKSAVSDVGEDFSRRISHAGDDDGKPTASPKKFTEDETRETGSIKWKIYAEYIHAAGGFGYWAFIMLLFACAIVTYLARTFWISVWTRSYHTENAFGLRLMTQGPTPILRRLRSEIEAVEIDPNLWYYLGVYVALSLGAWFIGTSRYFSIFVASIRASKTLFENLAYAILRAPLRFLDTTPLGRILNRFTSDFNMLDSRISMDLAFMLHNAMQVLEVVVAGLVVSPFMIVFAVALLVISLHYALRYLAGAREVKRLESNAKSPVFDQFSSVLTGIGTIRAFDKADAYIDRMYAKIDQHCQAYWHLWLFNRWMGFRLNMVGAVFAAITAALIVSITTIDASLAGFALSFSLTLSESVIWMLRQYANVEIDMNATERIVEYSNNPTEDQGGDDAPAAWPTEGRLEVSDLVVGYAPDLPPVLRGLTFSVEKNQRIGVVGRTGAGKSSLTMALFRFLEPRSGSIYIDGIDVSKIKLHDLRSRLAIIPQDPVLFSGTVRSNLDAFNQHSDTELRDALARVHLISSPSAGPSGTATPSLTPNNGADSNTNIFKSLNSKISEGGLNLSQGQRQLLCLARAIVSRPKIMVLDEATSAVDMETDALIQRSIREEFQDATLIVIAHRLSTIADFDRILVMGEGRVLEFDSPGALMEKEQGGEGGEFRKMVEESGERRELEGIIRGARSGV